MKDPAFLFYPGDWIAGTMLMTLEERGAYISLLMCQFNNGHMTIDMMERMISHMKFIEIWPKIKGKFIEDENGNFYNDRLEFEQIKRRKYVESRGKNRKQVKKDSNEFHMIAHMNNHMENENENINRDINKNKGKHLFKNSVFSTPDIPGAGYKLFCSKLDKEPYNQADMKYYYEAVKNWSASKNEKRADWAAVARNFILSDQKAGKLKTATQIDKFEKI